MPRHATPLTVKRVQTLGPGTHYDGDGLLLRVRGKDLGWWIYRYRFGGKVREMGLGRARGRNPVSLADVRERHAKLRDQVKNGIDPLAEAERLEAEKKAQAALEAASRVTFRKAAELYLGAHEHTWRNAVHRQQWHQSLKDYVYPVVGDLPVAEIDTNHVMQIIAPLWQEKSETGSRTRGRLESILSYATANKWRSGENPAEWKSLRHLLPARAKVAKVEHHAAIDWREAGAFMAKLRQDTSVASRCLQYTILTACRSGESRGATWSEIDLSEGSGGVWRLPASRMKAGAPHVVPLSPATLEILQEMAALRQTDDPDALVFPSTTGKVMVSHLLARPMNGSGATVHGWRSTFADWAAERGHYEPHVTEMSLAHTISSQVERAYRRGNLFERRRSQMNEWARFLSQPMEAGKVIPLKKVSA
jgi:integrase